MDGEFDQRDPEVAIPPTVEVKLKQPLKKTASEEMLEALIFRTPSLKDIRRVAEIDKRKGDVAAAVEMLVLLNEHKLIEQDIDRLSALDFQRCSEALGPFTNLRPATSSS